MGCAHVEIVNEGEKIGVPGPLVRFPGVYEFGQPGTWMFLFRCVAGELGKVLMVLDGQIFMSIHMIRDSISRISGRRRQWCGRVE